MMSKSLTLGTIAVVAATAIVMLVLPDGEVAAVPSRTSSSGGAGVLASVDARPATEGAGRETRAPVAHVAGAVEPSALRVRVLAAADHEPVAGIDVVALVSGEEQAREHGATTDEAGRASFEFARELRVDRIEALPGARTGLARTWLRRPAAELTEELELLVESGGTLAGRVVDSEGRAVPGALVRGWCRSRVDGDPHRDVRAGADGSFVLQHLGPEFVVEARASGLTPRGGLHGRLAPGEEARGLELVLGPAQVVEGEVVDLRGFPVAGAEVWCDYSYGTSAGYLQTSHPGVTKLRGSHARSETDAHGRFRLEEVGGRTVRVHVKKAPYLVQSSDRDPEGGPHRIVLDTGLALEGEVLDAAGRPAAGARVRFGPYWGNVHTAPDEVRTDEGGRFRVQGFRPKENDPAPYLVVLHEGCAVHVEQPVVPDRERGEPVAIRLEPASAIEGRVIDGAQRGVPDVAVWVEGSREMDPGFLHGRRSTWEWRGRVADARTDGEGRFRFEHLYEGEFRVHAVVDGEDVSVPARAGGEPVVLDLAAERADRVRVVGHVLDASNGEPLRAFWITPLLDGSGTRRSFEDEGGEFELPGLEPGEYEWSVGADGYASRSIPAGRLTRGEHDVELELWPAASLRLRIVDGAGAPVSGAEIRLRDASSGELLRVEVGSMATTDVATNQGRTVAHGLPARPLLVEARRGLDAVEREVDLSRAQLEEVELVLVRTPEVAVNLLLLALAPASAEDDALARYAELRAAEDGAGFREWIASGEVAFPASPVQLVVRTSEGELVARAGVEPAGDGQFAIEAQVFEGRSSRGHETQLPVPTVALRLPARRLEVSTEGDRIVSSKVSLDLTRGEPLDTLVLLRAR